MNPEFHYKLKNSIDGIPFFILIFYVIWGVYQIFAIEEEPNFFVFDFISAIENEWLQLLCWVIPGAIVTILLQMAIKYLFRRHFIAICPTCSKPLRISTQTEREVRSQLLSSLKDSFQPKVDMQQVPPIVRKLIPILNFFLTPKKPGRIFTHYTCRACGYRKFFATERSDNGSDMPL
ncbi:MAG: hypothetical protein SAJ37_03135 [Oscillatoria sp. PMC 1068.18]|nr:hypothetical protein [Oscillatoria sp. PMC 1076.18]MEC4987719.1 hypothetical protein [Oscillatoria sp. PMC 1068.18]